MNTVFPLPPDPKTKTNACSRVMPVRLYPAHCCKKRVNSASFFVASSRKRNQVGQFAVAAVATAVALVISSLCRAGLSSPVRKSTVPAGVPRSQGSVSQTSIVTANTGSERAKRSTPPANDILLVVYRILAGSHTAIERANSRAHWNAIPVRTCRQILPSHRNHAPVSWRQIVAPRCPQLPFHCFFRQLLLSLLATCGCHCEVPSHSAARFATFSS